MTVAISAYLEQGYLNHIFKNTPTPAHSSVFVALTISTETGAGGGQEVTGAAYARQEVVAANWNSPAYESGGGYQVDNNADITFPVAGDNWGNLISVGLWTSASGGNLLFYGDLTAAKVVATGDQFKILSGNLIVKLR